MQKKFFRLPHIITYLCAFVFGMKQLREPDIWWQLLTGRWMIEHGAITRVDDFSYTMNGAAWVNVKWLYEVIIALIEKVTGPHGVILLQSIVNVMIVYLLFRIIETFSDKLSSKVSVFASVSSVLLFLCISEYRLAGRPEMVSYLMTVIYLFIILKNDKLGWKQLLPLILLQCLWANMHEGYPIGLVIIGTFAVSALIAYLIYKKQDYLQQTKRLSIVWLAAAIAILINPNTITLWKQPFEIFRQLRVNKYTTELYSYTQQQYWTLQAKLHIAMLLLVIVFWIARIIINRKKKDLTYSPFFISYLLLIILTGYLSLIANRNIPISEIVLIPSLPIIMHWCVTQLKLQSKTFFATLSARASMISIGLGVLLYASIVSNAFYNINDSSNRYGIHLSMLHNPIGAVDYIQRNNIKGLAFSDYFISSYMLWAHYPQFKSFIDLRDLDVFSADFFEDYNRLGKEPSMFYTLDSQYHFNYIVLSTSQLLSVQQNLYWGQGFNLVYVDPVSVIYLKDSRENDYINRNFSSHKLFSWGDPYADPAWATILTKVLNPFSDVEEEEQEKYAPRYAALFYNAMGNYKIARKLLLPELYSPTFKSDALAFSTIGNTYIEFANQGANAQERQSRLDTARMFLTRAIELDPKISSSYTGLANLYLMKGEAYNAIANLNHYIELEPNNDFGYYMRGFCYHYQLKETGDVTNADKMIKDMKQSVVLNSDATKSYLYIAEGYSAKKDIANTKHYLQQALDTKNYWTNEEKEMIEKLKKLTGIN